jgi:hypothetical protein
MAAQLTELPFDLGAVWKGEVRHHIREAVQSIDLTKEGRLAATIEAGDEVEYRLSAIQGAVIDSLKR